MSEQKSGDEIRIDSQLSPVGRAKSLRCYACIRIEGVDAMKFGTSARAEGLDAGS